VKLYTYIVTHDTGFAPNPFWGWCTLATCKPVIRRTAKTGDWIVGLSPKAKGNRVVFAMEIETIIEDHASYFRDRRFANKIPDDTKGELVWRAGDNIYKPLANGGYRQLRSMHSHGDEEDPKRKIHDLGGKRVLVAEQFHYFGDSGPQLPSRLEVLKVRRGHKNRFSKETIRDFLKFIASHRHGVSAPPTKWRSGDRSWKQQA